MNENLVGYLLKALDPEAEAEVESYLRTHPEARQRLKRLQRALEPLAADQESVEPPAGLWVRTLGRVAEYKCRHLPFAPAALPSQIGGGRSRWRWPDFFVAAAVVLIATGLGLGGLNHVWYQHQMIACQNNLRRFNSAFVAFGNHHNGELPSVEGKPAGMVVPMLHEAGVLGKDINIGCSSRGQQKPDRVTVGQIEALRQSNPEQYEQIVGKLMGCYAYNLGYRDENGVYHHYTVRGGRDSVCEWVAVMADRPPFAEVDRTTALGNSPNHGGRGQNVLFIGGQVKFITGRDIERDNDIYLNRQRRIGAGRDQDDVVLGASWACP